VCTSDVRLARVGIKIGVTDLVRGVIVEASVGKNFLRQLLVQALFEGHALPLSATRTADDVNMTLRNKGSPHFADGDR
jgi:hypothetical protein